MFRPSRIPRLASRYLRTGALALLISVGFGLPVVGYQHRAAQAESNPVSVQPAPRGVVVDAVFRPRVTTAGDRLRSAFGIVALLGICWGMSRNRKAIDWRLVAIGLAMQGAFAVFLLRFDVVLGWLAGLLPSAHAFDGLRAFLPKLDVGKRAFNSANDAIVKLLDFSSEGAAFLFRSMATGKVEPANHNFAFGVLPSIVFFSSVMAVMYHLGVMQWVVRGIAWAMQRSMRTSGAETLSTAANIFVGQTEAPLLVRPFIAGMTKSELLVIMAGGMANTAGGVLAAYVGMLYAFFPDIAGHLLAESLMSAPAALVTSKMIWPEDGVPATRNSSNISIAKTDSNVVEAAARGASEGLALAFNVAAMLIAFIALVALMDGSLLWVTSHIAALFGKVSAGISFQEVAGWVFIPFAWIMGTPWEDCRFVGQLLGQKIVLNEFVAYGTLSQALQTQHGFLSERAVLISSYALSGFANFGSIAMQIGGIGAMAPSRRGDIAALGILAMLSGSFATFMTACFAASLV